MRVALYAGTFRRDRDGATRTLYELVKTLARERVAVGIWAYEHSLPLPDGVVGFRLPSITLPLSPDYRLSLPFPDLEGDLDAFTPDVVHVTVPDLVGLYLLHYARKRGIAVLCTFHTDFVAYLPSFHLGFLQKVSWRYLRWFYGKAGRVLAPTRVMIQQLDHQGVGAGLWSRGIDEERFHPSFRSQALRRSWGAEGRVVVLYVGRLVPYKGLEVFCGVYQRFAREGWLPRTRFVLVGEGGERRHLAERMPEAVFTGHLGGEDLSRAWASGDLLLFPSVTETFGNVVQEALASGLPAVVSDRGGCSELVRSARGGLVCPGGDGDAFADACQSLVFDPSRRLELARYGQTWARRQSWERVNHAVLASYRVLAARGTRAGTQDTPSLGGTFS